jgi:hypothetical protein
MMTKGSKSGRNAEGDFFFLFPHYLVPGISAKCIIGAGKTFFGWIHPVIFQVTSPKKSFSGTNNAKILQKSPPPETCREQEKEIMEITMSREIRIVGKKLSEKRLTLKKPEAIYQIAGRISRKISFRFFA